MDSPTLTLPHATSPDPMPMEPMQAVAQPVPPALDTVQALHALADVARQVA